MIKGVYIKGVYMSENEYLVFVKDFCIKTCNTEECKQLCLATHGLDENNRFF